MQYSTARAAINNEQLYDARKWKWMWDDEEKRQEKGINEMNLSIKNEAHTRWQKYIIN